MELAGFLTSLFNGVLVDRYPPVLILAGMLTVAAVTNALMCFTDSVALMTMLWGINGFAQAFGWPCMAKIFMNWFPDPAERGKLYSILSTCQNVGTALVPIVRRHCKRESHMRAVLNAIMQPRANLAPRVDLRISSLLLFLSVIISAI